MNPRSLVEIINLATIQIALGTPDASQAATRFAGNGCSIDKKRNKGMARIWHPVLIDSNKDQPSRAQIEWLPS